MNHKNSNSPFRKDRILEIIPVLSVAYSFILTPVLSFQISKPGFGDVLINESVADGSLYNKIFWIILSLGTLYLILTGPALRPRINVAVLLLGLYLLLAIASVAWSSSPLISLRRVFLQISLVICVLLPFVFTGNAEKILHHLSIVFAIIVVMNVVAIPIVGVPDFGYQGIYSQKNSLAQVMFVSAVFMFWRWRGSKNNVNLFLLFFLFAILVCYISKSKTTQGLMLIIPVINVFSFFINRLDRLTGNVAKIILLLLAILVFGFFLYTNTGLSEVSMVLFGDPTFTGRTMIWEFVLDHVARSPILGHGYGAFWGVGGNTAAIVEDAGFITGLLQAHDGYLDVLLETGIIGLSMAASFMYALHFAILKSMTQRLSCSTLMMVLFYFVIFNNLMESSIFRSDTPLWMVTLIVLGSTLAKTPRVKTIEASSQR